MVFLVEYFCLYPIKVVLHFAELFRHQSQSSSNQRFGLLELDPMTLEVGH